MKNDGHTGPRPGASGPTRKISPKPGGGKTKPSGPKTSHESKSCKK